MAPLSCIQTDDTYFLSHSWADETDLMVPWPISLLISNLKYSVGNQTIQ